MRDRADVEATGEANTVAKTLNKPIFDFTWNQSRRNREPRQGRLPGTVHEDRGCSLDAIPVTAQTTGEE